MKSWKTKRLSTKKKGSSLFSGKAAGYLMAICLLLALWLCFSLAVNKPFFPGPYESFRSFFVSILDGTILSDFLTSGLRILASIALALLIGVPLGLFMGTSRLADRFLSPVIYVLYPLPKVVFLPVIVIMLGLGNPPKIVLITLVIVFQIVVTVRDSAKSIPQAAVQSMRSLNAGKWQMYRHLIFPYCLPQIYSALRVSIGISVAILFFSETFASTDGLGYYIMDSMQRRNYPHMYGGIIAMGLLGIIAYKGTDFLQELTCRWKQYE